MPMYFLEIHHDALFINSMDHKFSQQEEKEKNISKYKINNYFKNKTVSITKPIYLISSLNYLIKPCFKLVV